MPRQAAVAGMRAAIVLLLLTAPLLPGAAADRHDHCAQVWVDGSGAHAAVDADACLEPDEDEGWFGVGEESTGLCVAVNPQERDVQGPKSDQCHVEQIVICARPLECRGPGPARWEAIGIRLPAPFDGLVGSRLP